MISKYFSNKNSFDLIEDPIKQNTGSGYWYLQGKNNQEYCWNNEVFSDNEIERIKVIGRRLGGRSIIYFRFWEKLFRSSQIIQFLDTSK